MKAREEEIEILSRTIRSLQNELKKRDEETHRLESINFQLEEQLRLHTVSIST